MVPETFAVDMSAGPIRSPEIGRIDRRGFDPDHDFVVGRFGRRDIHQRQFEFAALLEQRTQLQPVLAVTHRNPPVFVCEQFLDDASWDGGVAADISRTLVEHPGHF